jgi:hypothetical protein
MEVFCALLYGFIIVCFEYSEWLGYAPIAQKYQHQPQIFG